MAECQQPDDETINCVRIAAEVENDAEAQCRLGDFYAYGTGREADFTLAAAWYRRAAEKGHLEAQFRLGSLLSSGAPAGAQLVRIVCGSRP